MHSLPNRNTVRRFRVAALLLLLKWLSFTGFLGLFGCAMWGERSDFTYLSMGLLGISLIASLGHWVIGVRARCPLCLVPSFSHQQCSKHRNAPHFLGSYRVFVALAVVFKGYFRCPYCGEPTAMEVRSRPRKSYR